MRNPTGTWIVVVGDGNAEPCTAVSNTYLDFCLNSTFLLPLLSALPETSSARCEASVAELLAAQQATKTASCLKFIKLCGPLRYRFFQTSILKLENVLASKLSKNAMRGR